MDLAFVHTAQGSSKVPFHANIILLLRVVLYAIVSHFRLHQAGVELGEKAFWTQVMQVPPNRRNPRSQGKDTCFPGGQPGRNDINIYGGHTERAT
jgi:hypothetical protein